MALLEIRELSSQIPFGAQVSGVTLAALEDSDLRGQLRDLFDSKGVLVFRDMGPDPDMHLALSAVFGDLAHHGLSEDRTGKPEVVNLQQAEDVIEIDGRRLAAFLPWHFDACYTKRLNRAALLRPVVIPPSGGMTGFADGVQLYDAISPDLRREFEDARIVYYSKLMFMHQKFGFPGSHKWISLSAAAAETIAKCEGAKRSVHPAVWQRPTGEKVLHVSPWQAAGISGREDAEGDALLEELCQEIYSRMIPYWHEWQPTDMVLWDNLRMIHAVSGNEPGQARHMQRATIEGDYGLGAFEEGATGNEPPMMG